MMTEKDFILKDQAYQRSRSQRLLSITASLIGCAGIYTFIFRFFFVSDLSVGSMVASFAIFLAVMLAHIPVGRWLSNRLEQRHAVNCFKCGHELTGNFVGRVITTGCCQNCSEVVFIKVPAAD